MIANYHTHTWRCNHAVGTEREYVENAIAGGIKILGFSDHTPQTYEGGYHNDYKMNFDQVEGYVDTVLALRKEYEKDIEIHLGLEVEYYPKYYGEMQERLKDYPLEYYILGQHYPWNEVGEEPSSAPTTDEARLTLYCATLKEALSTGDFLYVAHPDLLNFVGDPVIYDRHYRDLCIWAKEHNIPLEINFLGVCEGRHYPNKAFWKIAGEVGVTAVFGSDAHAPDKVWNPEGIRLATAIAEENHLQVAETLPL